MSLTVKFRNAYHRAQQFTKNFHTNHPYIYAACKFFIHEGLHCALDCCGTLLGDPPLFEEIEAIYFGVKMAVNISYKLYHYLKGKTHVHRKQIEHMPHHERGHSAHHARGHPAASQRPRSAPQPVRRTVGRSWRPNEDEEDSQESVDDDSGGGSDDGDDSDD
jgi:hypothetical protein